MDTSKEIFKSHNTLACVAKGVIGLYTTVDLRNDSYVSGKIEQVDGFMNITVSDAIFTDACGNECFFEFFFVKERNVRYLHIPNEVSIPDTLVKKIFEKPVRRPPPRPMTLKRKKLLLRQQETLERVRQIKMERLKKKIEKEKSELQAES